MPIEPGRLIAKKYRLTAPLARGGMGAIWTARHVSLGSQVAVKFLDPRLSSSPSFVARFEREARAAASIQSPHVVMVHDFGVDDGTPYLAMELLRGEDLRQRIKKLGRLSPHAAAGILVQAGKGLRRAHELGIIHRDIKPGNLFLAKVDDDEVVKVLDFGIAKESETLDEHTKTGELVGSPHYVSPEQARGQRDLDHRSDVWSLGVIAYRMVTGQLPFPGEALGDVLARVLVDPPPKVGSLVSGLPASLDGFFAKALAKKREDRYGSVRELVDAFVAIVNDDEEEDAFSPPSWSTILTVSFPEDGAPQVAPATGILKRPAPPAEPCAMDVPVVEQATTVRSVEGAPPAQTTVCSEDSSPPPSASGKRDSLMPAMGPHFEPLYPHPLLRFRWVAAAAVSLGVMVTLAVSWTRTHAALSSGTGGVDVANVTVGSVRSAPDGEMPPPAEAPRSAALPLSSTGPSPSLGLPPSTASTSMTATGNNGMPVSTTQPARSAGVSAPPAGTATGGTRRKWGF